MFRVVGKTKSVSRLFASGHKTRHGPNDCLSIFSRNICGDFFKRQRATTAGPDINTHDYQTRLSKTTPLQKDGKDVDSNIDFHNPAISFKEKSLF